METINYYVLAIIFILLILIARRIVQIMCYESRGNEYKNLTFRQWVKHCWNND